MDKPYGTSAIPEFIYGAGACPRCGGHMHANLQGDKRCTTCRYSRPAADPGWARIGVCGNGNYQALRGRLLALVARLKVGAVNSIEGSNLAEPLALELEVDCTRYGGAGHYVALQGHTHVLSVGWTPGVEAAQRRGLPLRVIRRP